MPACKPFRVIDFDEVFTLCREIVETMVKAYSQKVFNGQKPVFDGRKNLYSHDPLPIGREKVGTSSVFMTAAEFFQFKCTLLMLLLCSKLLVYHTVAF